MDAQSLHKHIESSTKQRIHAKSKDEELDDTVVEEIKDEISDNSVAKEEKVEVELPEKEPEDNSEEEKIVELPKEETTENDSDVEEDESKAKILSMHEEKHPSFNAFSSHHASAPLPPQNNRAPVEEAKPVKDNTMAIILILLIAILIIAVAIFGIVVLREYRTSQENNQTTSSSEEIPTKTDSEKKTINNNYEFSEIIGKWNSLAEDESCIDISDEGIVSWFQKCGDKSSDHYSGESEIISGQDAIDKFGITKDRAIRILGLSESEYSLDKTYAVTIFPTDFAVGDNTNATMPSAIKLLVAKTGNELRIYNYHYVELGIFSTTDTAE